MYRYKMSNTNTNKQCSFCDAPAVTGGETTAFCLIHRDEWRELDKAVGWEKASVLMDRVKVRDVNFVESKSGQNELS